MGNAAVSKYGLKTHNRTKGIAQQEIFEEWDVRHFKKQDLGTIVAREPLMLPVEYNSLYQRRIRAFKVAGITA